MEKYLKCTDQFRNYEDEAEDPVFSKVLTLDLATVVSSLSGPKRYDINLKKDSFIVLLNIFIIF